MPIDFPTVKYGDPTPFPPSTPAATDTVMARTSAGADRNFYLGNLAGIAGLTAAADLSIYYNGSAWAAYTVTSVGRTLLAATTQAAQRAAIQAVGLVGNESIAGIKTYTDLANFQSMIRMPSGVRAEWGDGTSVWGAVRASNTGVMIVSASQPGTPGQIYFRPNGDTNAAQQLLVDSASFRFSSDVRPITDNSYNFGGPTFRMITYYGVNSAINTSDARLKTEPRQLRDPEFKAFSAVCRLPPVWRWLNRVHGDENCEPEGRAARKHFGPTVQAAMQVFADNGLDAFENAPFCYDEWEAKEAVIQQWDDEFDPETGALIREAGSMVVEPAVEAGDRYSFRKEELLCGMVSALARESDEKDAKIEAQQVEMDHLKEAMAALLARVAVLEAKA